MVYPELFRDVGTRNGSDAVPWGTFESLHVGSIFV